MGRERSAPGIRRDPDASDVPLALPAPYEALSESANLIEVERRDLAACEAAIDGLRLAFWAAGKALHVIRDGRLYRAEFATFDDYCDRRWQMTRRQADRLIRAWPLAEILSPIGGRALNELQVRELLPLASDAGDQAAVIVYETVVRAAAEVDGVRVTAAVVQGAVGTLADGPFDKDAAMGEIRAYVARLAAGADGDGHVDPVTETDRWDAEADRVRTTFARAFRRNAMQAAARSNPAGFRELVAELRNLLDEVEKEAAL